MQTHRSGLQTPKFGDLWTPRSEVVELRGCGTLRFGFVIPQMWICEPPSSVWWNPTFGVKERQVWVFRPPDLGLWTSKLGFVNPQVWVYDSPGLGL